MSETHVTSLSESSLSSQIWHVCRFMHIHPHITFYCTLLTVSSHKHWHAQACPGHQVGHVVLFILWGLQTVMDFISHAAHVHPYSTTSCSTRCDLCIRIHTFIHATLKEKICLLHSPNVRSGWQKLSAKTEIGADAHQHTNVTNLCFLG